jgi:hypothetical protein
VLIPQHLRIGAVPAYTVALQSLTNQGASVRLQDKILKLSSTLPAILEGEATSGCLHAFLAAFPFADRATVVTQALAAAVSAAA